MSDWLINEEMEVEGLDNGAGEGSAALKVNLMQISTVYLRDIK